MTQITWVKTGNYEWTGTDEKENYVLVVYQSFFTKNQLWYILRDEDVITNYTYDVSYPVCKTADEAKARAEKALENYLNEQADFTNCLREVLQVEKPTALEKEMDRLKFYYDKP